MNHQRVMLSPSAKVGIMTVAVIIVVVMVGIFLKWQPFGRQSGYTVNFHFDSSRGLTTGSKVQKNGVNIGDVIEIDTAPDQGANIKVRLKGDIPIHRNAIAVISPESVLGQKIISLVEPLSGRPDNLTPDGDWINPQAPAFTIPRGSLRAADPVYRELSQGRVRIGSVVEVTPIDMERSLATFALDPGKTIAIDEAMVPGRGIDGPTSTIAVVYPRIQEGEYLEGTKEPEATDILVSVNDVIMQVNDLIRTLGPEIQQITTHLDEVLLNVNAIIDKQKIDALFSQLDYQLRSTGQAIDSITGEIEGLLRDTRPVLTATLASAQRTTESMEGIASEVETLVKDEETRAKLESLLTELEASSKSLNAAMANIAELTGDVELQADLKGTLKAARSSLEKADKALGSVNTTAASIGGIQFGGSIRERYQPDDSRAFTDFRLYAERPKEWQIFAGASDIGEHTTLDAGYGTYLNENFLARGGLRRGKVGIGADLGFDPFKLSADLYDANDLTFDLFGLWRFNENWSAIVGGEDLFGDEGDRLNLGAQFDF